MFNGIMELHVIMADREMGLEIFLFNLAESVIRYWPDTV